MACSVFNNNADQSFILQLYMLPSQIPEWLVVEQSWFQDLEDFVDNDIDISMLFYSNPEVSAPSSVMYDQQTQLIDVQANSDRLINVKSDSFEPASFHGTEHENLLRKYSTDD